MPNGQTLMYIAAREGKYTIVKYMLEKKLNAKIKSKVDVGIMESCLQVAARWNCLRIVELLLENVNYEKEEIEEVIRYQNLPEIINKYLMKYYNSKFRRRNEDSVTCCC